MKIIVVLSLLCFQVQVRAGAQTVNLELKNVSLKELFTQLSIQTGYNFLYEEKDIGDARLSLVSFKNSDLRNVLEKCFSDQALTYRIEKNTVIIKRKAVNLQPVQKKTITGKIVDDKGEPLIGAAVKVKGSSKGGLTDLNGNFKIDASNGDILVFTYIGFIQQEIKVGESSSLTVTLQQDAAKLNEVVVVGYGTALKSDLTTSISSISQADIMKTPITSLEQALQGNAAGVLVTNTSGEPGGDVSIRIRGGSSIKADNEPLLVIDGFTSDEGFSSLNPADIESIEVLKDAGATAIFGSRGANGVIMVTTKAGAKGKPKVRFESYYGLQYLRRKLPLLNASELAQLANEAREAVGSSPNTLRPDTIPTNRDWQDLLFRRGAPQLNNTLTISGGDDKLKYYVSANYIDQQGLIVSSYFTRASLRGNLDFNLNKSISTGIRINLSEYNKRGVEVGDNGSILRANAANPYKSGLIDPSGSFMIDPETGDPIGTTELAKAQETIDKNKNIGILTNAYLKINIMKGLSFRSSGTYNPTYKLADFYFPNTIKGDKVSRASEQMKQAVKWSNDNVLTYNKSSKIHSYGLTLGQEITGSMGNDFKAEGSDYATDIFGYYNLGSGNAMPAISSSATKYSLLSFFGRATYNYSNRYLFAFTYRADGSSKFGENNRWGYFPSASFAWRASNEAFIKKLNLFYDLKFRATYGVNGSDRISAYSSQALYSSIATAIGGIGTGTVISRMANKDLRWEKTAETDLGIDVAFLKGRLSLTGDYYLKNTTDLLLDFALPAASGYTTVAKNIGSVRNEGYELGITSNNLIKKFKWTTSFNAAINRNKVTDLGGPSEISAISNSSANTKFGNVVLIRVGEPLGVFYGHRVAGVFQTQAEVDAGAKIPGVTTLPGFFRYVDTDNSGDITDADKVIIGNPQPKWNGGMTNTFSYKNIDLSVFTVFQQGNDILNTSGTMLLNMSGDNNQLAIVRDRWRAPNPETGDPGNPSNTIPRAYKGYTALMSDFYIEDGSYFRVKTVTLGYSLDKKLLSRMKIANLRFYVSGTNLLTATSYYGGYDPEVSIQGKKSVGAGMDNGSYPTTKMYTFGLNANF
ncbi:SusC/RagA family TonB-linked outer membrane protein [Pseudopedobacter saltans]|nr:SusC/RagA family TonB-linked outer membrane protein [Pseudopedobacter saltans]